MNPWDWLNELRKRVTKLSVTAESQAWGILGIVAGYIAWNRLNKAGSPWLTVGQFCFVSYSIAVATYALVSRTFLVLKRCLLSARLLFLGEIVTESEYNKMRAKCLKKAGAI